MKKKNLTRNNSTITTETEIETLPIIGTETETTTTETKTTETTETETKEKTLTDLLLDSDNPFGFDPTETKTRYSERKSSYKRKLTYLKNRGIDPFHHTSQLPKGLTKDDGLSLLKEWGFSN